MATNLLSGLLGDGDQVSSIFSAKPGGPIPTYDQLQNRRKIAQIMMARQNPAYPKNVGEGLSSIGGDIANALYMRQLNSAEAVKGAQDEEEYKRAMSGAVTPNAQTSENIPAVTPTQAPVAAADATNVLPVRDRIASVLQQQQPNPTGTVSTVPSNVTDFSAQSRAPIVPAPQTSQVVPVPTMQPPAVPGITPQMQAIQRALTVVGDPMRRQVLEQTLQQLQARELATYNQKMEEFKYQRERQQKGPQEQADLERTRQQTATGSLIDPNDKRYVLGPDGIARPLKVEGAGTDANTPPQVKMTAEQAKDQKFHGWTSLAEEQMQGKEGILANGLQQELAGKVPFVGNKIQAAEYRRVRSAAERFVQGFLRDISGAVISPEELAKHQATFLPRYGDDARTIADKKAAREQIISGLYAGAGPGREISDWETKQRRDAQVKLDTKLNSEMKDVPRVAGKVYKDTETGKRRVWNGSRWEEY